MDGLHGVGAQDYLFILFLWIAHHWGVRIDDDIVEKSLYVVPKAVRPQMLWIY